MKLRCKAKIMCCVYGLWHLSHSDRPCGMCKFAEACACNDTCCNGCSGLEVVDETDEKNKGG
jgi:hypothetical protein